MQLIIPDIEWAGDGVAVGLVVMEFVSITENGTKMNLPMPEPVKKSITYDYRKIKREGKRMEMTKQFVISSGHGDKVSGAIGILNEHNEAKKVINSFICYSYQ